MMRGRDQVLLTRRPIVVRRRIGSAAREVDLEHRPIFNGVLGFGGAESIGQRCDGPRAFAGAGSAVAGAL